MFDRSVNRITMDPTIDLTLGTQFNLTKKINRCPKQYLNYWNALGTVMYFTKESKSEEHFLLIKSMLLKHILQNMYIFNSC